MREAKKTIAANLVLAIPAVVLLIGFLTQYPY